MINSEEVDSPNTTTSLFLTKDQLGDSDVNTAYFSHNNELIIFRPSENDFGLLLEDTQDKSWLTVDDKFEALGTTLNTTFGETSGLRISVVEKPLIAVSRSTDTLYFEASKKHYGILMCTSDTEPVFLPHDAVNVIEAIKSHYALE